MDEEREINKKVLCRPCNEEMRPIQNEAMGVIYLCEVCKTTLEISYDKPSIVIDKMAILETNGGSRA